MHKHIHTLWVEYQNGRNLREQSHLLIFKNSYLCLTDVIFLIRK